jgi:hypothetical protein
MLVVAFTVTVSEAPAARSCGPQPSTPAVMAQDDHVLLSIDQLKPDGRVSARVVFSARPRPVFFTTMVKLTSPPISTGSLAVLVTSSVGFATLKAMQSTPATGRAFLSRTM